MTVTRSFFAWYRTGFTTALSGAPAHGRARAHVSANVTIAGTQRSAAIPVELAGPGDVTGVDPGEIRRTEPADGSQDFEPDYLPYLETVSPDLPWRFSPLGPAMATLADPDGGPGHTRGWVRPWLALVVLPEDQAALTAGGPSSPPTLTCDAAALPDSEELWAWAHVQVTTAEGEDPAAAFDDPGKSRARIVCPVRLAAGTAYRAFLVPAFRAGLREELPAGVDPLDPAWSTSGTARLPVYHSFSFSTGQAGTFETLARRLRPRAAPVAAQGTVISTDAPGWGIPGSTGTSTLMQGALRPLAGYGPAAEEEPPPDPALAGELARAVSADGIGPQLRPPLYGQDYANGTTTVAPNAAGWFTQLNTDPRRRLAAGLGAWCVAVEQDDLCDLAWQQLPGAGITRDAEHAALAETLAQSLTRRHGLVTPDPVDSVIARLARPGGFLSPLGLATAMTATSAGRSASRAASLAATTTRPADRFSPELDLAAYELLRAIAPEWLLPGAQEVPDDSVLLLRTNPAFTESFLVGLNHALARELTWRRYPLAPGGTMIDRFWSAAAKDPTTTIPAIGSWPANSALGSHTPSGDEIVLLIRGALLRRFPTAAVYLAGLHGDGTELHLAPTFSAAHGVGTSLYGFPISPTEALRPSGKKPGAVTAWYVVIQEAVEATRLGADDASGTPADETVTVWQDLSWGHPHLRDHLHIPVAGPLAGATRPLWGSKQPVTAPAVTWGADSGQLAAALQRPAFRVRIPVALWLTPTDPTA